jgi:hypothetical protein
MPESMMGAKKELWEIAYDCLAHLMKRSELKPTKTSSFFPFLSFLPPKGLLCAICKSAHSPFSAHHHLTQEMTREGRKEEEMENE